MEQPTIRKCRLSDLDAMRQVCILTSNYQQSQQRRTLVTTLYCDYYVKYETDNCFVVADSEDKAVGYILCCTNYDRYAERFAKEYLPLAKKLSFKEALFHRVGMIAEKNISKKYAAHMHIDILPEYQRMGLGGKLVDTLLARLKQIDIDGVFLIVGEANGKGVSFYKKYGFSQVKKFLGNIVFGIKSR